MKVSGLLVVKYQTFLLSSASNSHLLPLHVLLPLVVLAREGGNVLAVAVSIRMDSWKAGMNRERRIMVWESSERPEVLS